MKLFAGQMFEASQTGRILKSFGTYGEHNATRKVMKNLFHRSATDAGPALFVAMTHPSGWIDNADHLY